MKDTVIPYFKLPCEIIATVKMLEPDAAKNLFVRILNYVNDEEEIINCRYSELAFISIKNYINDNCMQYKETCVYIIKLSNEYEAFIKVGITSDIKKRFKSFEKIGYNVGIIYVEEYSNRSKAYRREGLYHRRLDKYSYTPKTLFAGYTECFGIDSIERINIMYDGR